LVVLQTIDFPKKSFQPSIKPFFQSFLKQLAYHQRQWSGEQKFDTSHASFTGNLKRYHRVSAWL
jgi:hypothetical protein